MGMMKLSIGGMHCEACVRRVRKAIEKVDGALVENVDVGSAAVAISENREGAVLEAVRQAGYEPRKAE
jgi:copper chaperone CopZ